jgi:hypothetical protein
MFVRHFPAGRSLGNVRGASRSIYKTLASSSPHSDSQSSSVRNAYQTVQKRFLRLVSEPKMATSPPFDKLVYYTAGTPNGLKPALLLEELGLKYEVVPIDIMKNVQKEQWYLDINPNGRIPALKDGEMRVFESGAIMLYLHDHYDPEKKFGYANGSPEYYEMLSWLMFQMSGIGPMQG